MFNARAFSKPLAELPEPWSFSQRYDSYGKRRNFGSSIPFSTEKYQCLRKITINFRDIGNHWTTFWMKQFSLKILMKWLSLKIFKLTVCANIIWFHFLEKFMLDIFLPAKSLVSAKSPELVRNYLKMIGNYENNLFSLVNLSLFAQSLSCRNSEFQTEPIWSTPGYKITRYNYFRSCF